MGTNYEVNINGDVRGQKFDAESTTVVSKLNRLTSAQIAALTNVQPGMIVFDTTQNALLYRNNTTWVTVQDMSLLGTMALQDSDNVNISGGRANFTLGIPSTLPSQVAFGSNSITQGALMPPMTTIQRLAINNPLPGLVVFDLTLSKLFYYDSSIWVQV